MQVKTYNKIVADNAPKNTIFLSYFIEIIAAIKKVLSPKSLIKLINKEEKKDPCIFLIFYNKFNIIFLNILYKNKQQTLIKQKINKHFYISYNFFLFSRI